jgi:hypothetical protein
MFLVLSQVLCLILYAFAVEPGLYYSILGNHAYLFATKQTEESQNGATGAGEDPFSSNGGKPGTGSGSSTGSNESNQEASSEEAKNESNFKSFGLISIDFSEIGSGWIYILCGNTRILKLNLHWILGNLSRTARKALARDLQKKEFEHNPWASSNSSSEGPNAMPSAGSTLAGAGAGTSQSNTSSSNTSEGSKKSIQIPLATWAFILKLLKASCGLKDPLSHSNAIFDSLRQWLGKNEITLFIRRTKGSTSVDQVSLDQEISKIVSSLKDKRKISKSDGKKGNKTTAHVNTSGSKPNSNNQSSK